jgi:hypothetical protein
MVDNLPSSYKFNPRILDQNPGEKRRIIKQLPGVHQTESLTKFFGSTVDHLFNPGEARPLNGYVGQYPVWHDPKQDHYLEELSRLRSFYQLESTMVSKSPDGEINSTLFYTDLINQLRFQGSLVNNHNRLFEQEFYTWCPPIDLDKLINFRQYYWVNSGVSALSIIGPKETFVGDGVTTQFDLPLLESGESDFYNVVTLDEEQIKVKVDTFTYVLGNGTSNNTFTYDDTTKKVTLFPAPAIDAQVTVWVSSDLDQYVLGRNSLSYDPESLGDVVLSSNQRITITNDVNPTYNGKTFIVEGVGSQIEIIEDTGGDLDPQYLVMARGCNDKNPWSTGNRWFHKDTIKADELVDLKANVATRPIVEFVRDLKLFKYGTHRRDDVDLVCDGVTDVIGSIHDRATALDIIDGVTLNVQYVIDNAVNISSPSLRLLINSDLNEAVNSRIYLVTILDNKLRLSPETDGLDVTGNPEIGEVVKVKSGDKFAGKELYFDGVSWLEAQLKTQDNQFPLFELFDYDGVSLADPEVYPGSTFQGSKLFTYQLNTSGSRALDSVLGFRTVHDKTGQFVFQNYLATETFQYGQTSDLQTIKGFYFNKTSGSTPKLSNDWYKADYTSRQSIVDRFLVKDGNGIFEISQEPASEIDNTPAMITVTRGRQNSGGEYQNLNLERYVDFFLSDRTLVVNEVQDGDIIEVKSFNPLNPPLNAQGFYEVPLNLQANPDYEEISTLAKGDYYVQFADIIANQPDFQGAVYDANNWRDSSQQRFRGTHIIQHSAGLLKTMLLSARENLDLMSSIRFVEAEYARFRSKFEQKITEFLTNGRLGNQDPLDTWVDTALEEINRGKTSSFAFYYSGVGITEDHPLPTYIPATASYLGVHNLYVPKVISDTTLVNPQYFLQGHDGSLTLLYGDIRDYVLLNLEKRIYESTTASVRTVERPVFDVSQWVSGCFSTSSYSYNEFLSLLQPGFERWGSANGLNYRTNDTFDIEDPMTWNWSSVTNKITGKQLQGHWRGIYQYVYDTDRPHTHPWEMLGFNNEPTWWTNRYGPAPYTSNNHILWGDLEAGRIFAGARRGINPRYARVNLRNYLPVDSSGKLVTPYQANLAENEPTMGEARADWAWGDGSPIETLWRRSTWFPYSIAQVGYLMKPAMFVEMSWDAKNVTKIFLGSDNEQVVNGAAKQRSKSSDLAVHGERDEDGNVAQLIGIQQWISDFLINRGADVTENFGNLVRGLGVQLAYKMGGFTDSSTLNVVTDSFDRVPNEDVTVQMYRSPSIREEFYSGAIVEWSGQDWKVFGYDVLNPYFKILRADPNSGAIQINSGERLAKISQWRASTYYVVGTLIQRGDNFYTCAKTHTSGKTFENEFWTQMSERPRIAVNGVAWYLEGEIGALVEQIPYGSSFKTIQEVVDVLNGYDRYLRGQGWIFDHSTDGIDISDWQDSVKKILIWQDNSLNAGDFIAVSPAAFSLKYRSTHGTIQTVERVINGIYAINDRLGQPIDVRSTNVVRADDEITITPFEVAGGIFGVRLYVSELEHIIILNNQTIFNDTIYNPLLNIRQPRVRLQGYRSENWRGRIDAPGFIVTDNRIVPNFERAADDFRRIFDIEGLENKDLQERGRANLGYAERDYLTNLMLTPTNQFEFYQGMVQQKGTSSVMEKLLRSNFIRNNKGLKFFDEWAVRVGDYGGAEVLPSLDLKLQQKEFHNNPQLIEFQSYQVDDVREISFEIQTGFSNLPVLGSQKYFEVWSLPQATELLDLHVEILDGLNSTSPKISIGDDLNTQKLFKLTSANDEINYRLDFKDSPFQYPTGGSIRVYITGAVTTGHIKVSGHYRVKAERFLDLAVDSDKDNILTIKDIFSQDTKTCLYKDARWVNRHPALDIKWPTRMYAQREKGMLPNAGYVNINDVKWTARNKEEFNSLFRIKEAEKPSVLKTKSVEFAYNGISTSPAVIPATELIGNSSKGFYRIHRITLDVTEAFVESAASITVGTISDPDAYLNVDEHLSLTGEHDFYPSEMINNSLMSNSAVYVKYNHLGLAPLGANIGKVKVTVEVEHIVESILPGDRAWVYDNGSGDWMTYRAIDTGVTILGIAKPTHELQSSVVTLSTALPDITGTAPIILDGVVSDEYQNIHTIRTVNQARFTLDGSKDEVELMYLFYDAGMVVDKLTFNVVRAFTGGSEAAAISVGSADDTELFLNRFEPINDDASYANVLAPKPAFLYGRPIEIDIFDTSLKVAEGDSTVSVEVVRSGNIYLTPSSIAVSSSGSGYTSPPEVVVTGPEGLKATAVLAGGVLSIDLTNAGEGYTSVPTVELVGGGGSGAVAVVDPADLEDGRILGVTISNAGTGYTSAPTVLFHHDYGSGAAGEARMNYGVSRVVIQDPGKCNYSGAVAPVVTFSGGGVVPGVSGTHAVATLATSPTVPLVSTVRWRYRLKGALTWTTPSSNTLTFNSVVNPGVSGKDHWLRVIALPVPSSINKTTTYEIQLYDGVNATAIDRIAEVQLVNTTADNHSIDLAVTGTTVVDGSLFNADDSMIAYLEANGNRGLLTVVVDYHYESGFELLDASGSPISGDEQGEGGNLLIWEPTRFATLNKLNTFTPLVSRQVGDIVEIDGPSGWRVLEWSGDEFRTIRTEGAKVDSNQITKAAIYNTLTNNVEQVLQLYDPYKGIIPGVADREITYKLPYDPAGYNAIEGETVNEPMVWGDEQVGTLWWDISAVRYLEYESSTTEYRWKNWGRMAPGSTIEVYEWTKSTIHPKDWEASVSSGAKITGTADKLSGEVRPGTLGWVETSQWNPVVQAQETVYYFWLKNVTTPSKRVDRKLTAIQVASVITDPVANDIPYFAVIQSNKVIVGGVKQFLTDEDTVLKINWAVDGTEVNHHKQWMLIREKDERNIIDTQQWSKLTDSVVGWDSNSEVKNVKGVTLTSVFNEISETITVSDASQLLPVGELEIGGHWFTYAWKQNNTLFGITNTTETVFGVGTAVEQKSVVENPRMVPAPLLTKSEALGNLIRPRQSWFAAETDGRPSHRARSLLIESINAILSKKPFVDVWFNWREVFESSEPLPYPHEYSFEAPDMDYRDALLDEGQVVIGQRILLTDTQTANGFWTLWRYDPSHPQSDSKGFFMERAQKWRMQEGELWQYADWYAEGWSKSDFPNYRFADRATRDAANIVDETLLKGTLVQIDRQDANDSRWSWSVYTNGGWEVVAVQNGTIELKDSFYRSDALLYGYQGYDLTAITKRDGSHELRWLLGHFYDTLFDKLQINELFFDMLKGALALNQQVDWAFKTSFLYLGGYSEELRQSPLAFKDQIDNVVKYVEEVKPYHVKIRDYVRRLSTKPDIARTGVTDFDRPVYATGMNEYRNLRFNDPLDLEIMQTRKPWKDWYDNYQNGNLNLLRWDATWNPIRRLKTRVLFDRIASDEVSGWDMPDVPWDSNEDHYTGTHGSVSSGDLIDDADPYGDIAVRNMDERNNLVRRREISAGTIVTVARDDTQWIWDGTMWHEIWAVSWDRDWASSMVDRVNQYYEPRPGMKRKAFNELLEGVDFRGTTALGDPFAQGMYDQYVWDFESGWGNERELAIGVDVSIEDRSFLDTAADVDGIRTEAGERTMDPVYDEESGLFKVPTTLPGNIAVPVVSPDIYGPAAIMLDGGDFIQPTVDSGHPDELLKMRPRAPLVITVYQKTGGLLTQPTAMRFFKSGMDRWEAVRLLDKDVTLAEDLTVIKNTSTEVTIQAPSAIFPFHDPENPSQPFLDSLRLNLGKAKRDVNGDIILDANGDIEIDEIELAAIAARTHPGVIWIGKERLVYWGVEALAANKFKLTGVERGTGSTSRAATEKQSRTFYNASSTLTLAINNANWDGLAEHVFVTLIFTAAGKPTYVQRLNLGPDYIVQGTNVVLTQAATTYTGYQAGYSVTKVLIAAQTSNWTNGNAVKIHAIGDEVLEGSITQWLPGVNGRAKVWPENSTTDKLEAQNASWRTFLLATVTPGPERI